MAATEPPRPAELWVERFLDQPTRDLGEWARLWQGDHAFPLSRRAGLRGRLGRLAKRLLRPLALFATRDLWDRQRTFNLVLIETLSEKLDQTRLELEALRAHVEILERQNQAVHEDHQGAIEAHARLLEGLDVRTAEGFGDLLRHGDALFSRVDWKLDRYRRETREQWGRLGAFIAATEAANPMPLARVQREQTYLELERRYRGSEAEITERIAAYQPVLEKCGDVLDLGAGRGEAVELFLRAGLAARGVDSNAEMVASCRAKGLDVVEGDLFEHLAGLEEGSVGAIVSFHVIEHLAPERIETLVRLAWRALRSGGVLILETPSPLALAMSARDFWIDPTHARPVHPASLEVAYREAGFEPVHRLDLHPFPAAEHLPEIDLAALPEAQHALADHVNRLRDLLDDLLFGCRDFGMVGHKG